MTKKNFVALADAIRAHNKIKWADNKNRQFNAEQLEALANFCQSQNGNFMRERWLEYVAGNCGKSGGSLLKGRS